MTSRSCARCPSALCAAGPHLPEPPRSPRESQTSRVSTGGRKAGLNFSPKAVGLAGTRRAPQPLLPEAWRLHDLCLPVCRHHCHVLLQTGPCGCGGPQAALPAGGGSELRPGAVPGGEEGPGEEAEEGTEKRGEEAAAGSGGRGPGPASASQALGCPAGPGLPLWLGPEAPELAVSEDAADLAPAAHVRLRPGPRPALPHPAGLLGGPEGPGKGADRAEG